MTDLRHQLQTTMGDAYAIERELGAGMSRVFVATERALGRQVVVKVLPGEMSGPQAVDRFRREIAVAAQLQHPHIVPLLAAGESAGLPWFTMPFIKGESLRARLAAGDRIPLNDVVRILREVASALAFAHEAGVVHRDIKPDNVLISSGSAMVTDFGVAKALSASTTADGGITAVGVALGTPAYMSPEQASADPLVDHRTDIYAWGILAYELLTGTTPFAGRPAPAILAAQVIEPVEPITQRRADIPPALSALVMNCLAKNPADRPQTAAEIVRILDTVNTPSQGTAAHARVATGPPSRGVPLFLAALVTVMAIVTAWVIGRGHNNGGAASAAGPQSLAVLPFENVGGDSTQEYFADGMTDDIASALVNSGVHVAARTSSYAFKGKHPTAQEVGNTLNVDAVLVSKVSRLGTRMHVSAELERARDASVIWSYSDDRDAADIFAVQHAIRDSIVSALRIHLAGTAHPARPEDPALHDVVLRARYLASIATRDAIQHAIILFRDVLAKDSLNTDARVGLAFALVEEADGYAPPSSVFPEALAQISSVLAIDSNNAQAIAMRAGLNAQYVYDWPQALKDADRASVLNPNDFLIPLVRNIYYSTHGMRDKLLDPAREMMRIDPLSPLSSMTLQWSYLSLHMYDSVLAVAGRMDTLFSGFVYIEDFRGYALGDLKRYAEAEARFRAAESVTGHRSAGLAWALAKEGKAAEARAQIEAIEREWNVKYVPPELIAAAWLALGDKEKAYAWLQRGIDVHSAVAIYLPVWPIFETIRDEPRFRAIVAKLNPDK